MAQRVWEKFLTEQDKATLVGKGERKIGFGERPALLLIDLYRWVFGDKPEAVTDAIKTWPGSCGLAGWNALPHIQKLLGKAREVGIPIIHVTGMDGVAVEPWAFRRDTKKRATMSAEELDRFRRRYDIVDQVKPIPGETVFKKVSPSAFWGSCTRFPAGFPRASSRAGIWIITPSSAPRKTIPSGITSRRRSTSAGTSCCTARPCCFRFTSARRVWRRRRIRLNCRRRLPGSAESRCCFT